MATVNVAVNERAFNDVIMAMAKYLEALPPLSGSGSFGPFSAGYSIGFEDHGRLDRPDEYRARALR